MKRRGKASRPNMIEVVFQKRKIREKVEESGGERGSTPAQTLPNLSLSNCQIEV